MNIQWRPEAEAVARANAVRWGGPLASRLRRIDYFDALRVMGAGFVTFAVGALVTVMWAGFAPGSSPWMYLVTACASLFAVSLAFVALFRDPEGTMRAYPAMSFAGLMLIGLLVSCTVAAGGELGIVLATFYVPSIAFGFYMLRLAAALTLYVVVVLEFAVVLVWLGRPLDESILLLLVMVCAMGINGGLIGAFAARLGRVAADEQAARESLAELAQDLEEQVQVQVQELERLGQLRRFLAPQIADAILSAGNEDVLKPHRRRIVAFFCDLRGFTAYTSGAEPEDVVGLLGEYYDSVGTVLRRHEATVGGYAGDGVMAFFGDPVETASPARDAVAAVLELVVALDDLMTSWKRRDVPLSYGIGLAYGFATLGEVGFDDRVDYTALGTVVNLAARLCDQASAGQVLMDHATAIEAHGLASLAEVGPIGLKGIPAETKVYTLA